MKAVGITGTCPRCGESVEMVLTKKQLKALLKGMHAGSTAAAELTVERVLGRDEKGDLKR